MINEGYMDNNGDEVDPVVEDGDEIDPVIEDGDEMERR